MDAADGPRAGLARLDRAAEDGRLAALAANHGLDLVVVFGSAAEGVADPADLDIAVGGRQRLNRFELTEDLIALAGTAAIDVMDLRRAGTVARHEALGYGYPLYESVDGGFADAQGSAVIAFMDSQWLRELDLQFLARR